MLSITVDGANYVAFSSNPPNGCGIPVSADTFKQWVSMAQAAFLAGKQLSVHWSPCAPDNLRLMSDVQIF